MERALAVGGLQRGGGGGGGGGGMDGGRGMKATSSRRGPQVSFA
jgi:hypothetical protein